MTEEQYKADSSHAISAMPAAGARNKLDAKQFR
jgi:hypothetical protein